MAREPKIQAFTVEQRKRTLFPTAFTIHGFKLEQRKSTLFPTAFTIHGFTLGQRKSTLLTHVTPAKAGA